MGTPCNIHALSTIGKIREERREASTASRAERERERERELYRISS